MKRIVLIISLATLNCSSYAGIFSSKQGKTFETRGTAVVMASGTFTTKIEERDIQIPRYIDVTESRMLSGITHDKESGWTKCRVPLKKELGWDGPRNRELIFDCKPLTYFRN
jgi:hypothetical protein